MTQTPIIQPARWSRNGIRIVVVPGAELPQFRLETDRRLVGDPFIPTGPFSSVEEAERAAEIVASALNAKIPA